MKMFVVLQVRCLLIYLRGNFDDLSRLYDIDVSNFQNMSDEEKNVLMSDLLPY